MAFFRILFGKMYSLIMLILAAGILGFSAVLGLLYHFGQDLPNYKKLANYDPPVVTRLYASDGRLFQEYATEKRVFISIQAIPKKVIQAFLASEDKNFYEHEGVDYSAILRSTLINLRNKGSGKRPVGGSTITQQVAKNFLLSGEVSYKRKIQEAILSYRIERAFSKDKILELYLNEIYLGGGAYGVVAAAKYYFNKSLDELLPEELAVLAGMPKAPAAFDPRHRPDAALKRRNFVLDRMVEEKVITPEEGAIAKEKPIVLAQLQDGNEDIYDADKFVYARYFAEEVRRTIMEKYGQDTLYEGGLVVKTTLDPKLQAYVEKAFREGLLSYDRRHGWRGPLTNITLTPGDLTSQGWQEKLKGFKRPSGIKRWNMAIVLKLNTQEALIGLEDGSKGEIPLKLMKWAVKYIQGNNGFPSVTGGVSQPADVLKVGDVVAVELNTEAPPKKETTKKNKKKKELETPSTPALKQYDLRQIPKVNGGMVVMDPYTGRVLAVTGGYSFSMSEYNRATQAYRQPGSSFKPFVYLAALEQGMTPATVVYDEPVTIGNWTPKNSDGGYSGVNTLRSALVRSLNLCTVYIAQKIGMKPIADVARRLGVIDNMPLYYPLVLGAGETTVLRMAGGYSMIANGCRKIVPTFIDHIQDRHGKIIYRHDPRVCVNCKAGARPDVIPEIVDNREQVCQAQNAYQMVSMLRDAVERGTGTAAKVKGYPIAGKTGSTNEHRDAWFNGFTPHLVVSVYIGMDDHTPLGYREFGGKLAAPIFHAFMVDALQGQAALPFPQPSGVKFVNVNRETGELANEEDRPQDIISEPFLPGTEPQIAVREDADSPEEGEELAPQMGDVY